MRITPEFTLPEKIIFDQTTIPALYEKSDVIFDLLSKNKYLKIT